jgi:transcription elongation factor GreA
VTESIAPADTWLSQEAYDRLQQEFDALVAARPEVSKRIEEAREEGDLRENGGYHAAKEEQGKQEARIRQLEQLLRTAKVGERPVVADKATPGTLVTIRFEGEDETETFLLGSREDHAEGYQIFSPSSPLGSAVLGHGAGDVVTYQTPRGATMKLTIVGVEPFHSV